MSDIACPKCGEPISIFGSGGGQAAADRLSSLVGVDVPVIASIPFTSELREGGDQGVPLRQSHPNSPAVHAFEKLVDALMVKPRSLVGVPLTLHT
jgi:ATP-binding protein involved in chromosome partitioning